MSSGDVREIWEFASIKVYKAFGKPLKSELNVMANQVN